MSDLDCGCGFSLASLDAEYRVEALRDRPNTEVELSCPLCSAPLIVKLQSLGVLARQTREGVVEFVRWRRPGTSPAGTAVAIGAFRLRFEALGGIEPRDVCHAAVVAFAAEGGDLKVPLLPIRREYFDCVDLEALTGLRERGQLGRILAGEYLARLPLRGFNGDSVEVRLPLAILKTAGRDETAIRDVNVRVWPNIPSGQWKDYLIGLSATGPDAAAVLGASRRLRLWGRGATTSFSLAGSVQREGDAMVGHLDERPTWLSVELTREGQAGDATADAIAGGLLQVPPAQHQPLGSALEMGLDFGTSNTCIAVQIQGSQAMPQLVPQVDEALWNLYLVRAGAEPQVHCGPDLWPTRIGFGRHQDLFPSELLFSRPLGDQIERLAGIAGWIAGVDFGIPAAGVRPTFNEAAYSLGEFKWRELLRGSDFHGKLAWVQAHYLAAVLSTAYVRWVIVNGKAPTRVAVKYAYPMAFDEEDLDTLRKAAEVHAAALLVQRTGIQWSLSCRTNESQAAAQSGATRSKVQVFVDMGGGSTDVACNVQDFAGNWETLYLTSVRYAGSALLGAYEGQDSRTTCLATGATSDTLRRAVREATSPNDVVSDPHLFDGDKERVRANRTRHFYGYVIELVARMIAAGLIEMRFADVADDGIRAFHGDVNVSLYFLGNGWRLNATATASPFKADLHTRTKERVMALVKDVIQAGGAYGHQLKEALKGRKLVIELSQDEELPHDKAAVAIGVLRIQPESDRIAASRPAGVLGWTTAESSKKGTRQIPWFAMYDLRHDRPPSPVTCGRDGRSVDVDNSMSFDDDPVEADEGPARWYEPLAERSSLDWEDGTPKLPEGLRTIKDLDAKFQKTLGALREKCARPGDRWLRRGPYEVLLEELFKRKLREIGS